MKKINIAELLKDCPKGMELDCTMYDNVTLIQVQEDNIYPIKIETPDGSTVLTKYGSVSYNELSKCIIFPKGETNWEGFHKPFEDGDVVISDHGDIHISKDNSSSYCCKRQNYFDATITTQVKFDRLATEEEKQKLFDAIKDNGYKWNPETKTLEKVIQPKFKVGDKVAKKCNMSNPVSIIRVGNQYYYHYSNTEHDVEVLPIAEQDDWELVPNKFDINTLVPFESKVLVRDINSDNWIGAFYSHYKPGRFYTIGNSYYYQCIPYEGNEHLLDTSNNCIEYYKTWE